MVGALQKRDGLRSFPFRPRLGSVCLASGPRPRTSGAGFFLEPLQPLQLSTAPSAILSTPTVERLLRYVDLAWLVRDGRALSLQHFTLPELRYDVLELLSFTSLSLVLQIVGIILFGLLDHFIGYTSVEQKIHTCMQNVAVLATRPAFKQLRQKADCVRILQVCTHYHGQAF